MDEHTDVSEVRPGEREPSSIRALTRIDTQTWPAARVEWLWHKLLTQEYAFDDLAMKIGPNAFLSQLFLANSEWYEIGDVGLVAVTGIIPTCNALVHYVVWDEIEPRELLQLQHQLFADLFERYQLNRLTAYIPVFNKPAIRMATLSGFKFEGEIRKVFLKNGVYHNIHIYGMLREEFQKREMRN